MNNQQEFARSGERVILVAVSVYDERETFESLDELEQLADTAGAETIARMVQNREGIHPGTYIGSGKIEELRDLIYANDVDAVICDDELSPAQMRNLQRELEIPVLDRTVLILDIFAQRAQTAEGRIQVELAQLQYRMTHLSGLGISLSRQGGGIGTRGPGEKKLETDRRLIRGRISRLKAELEDIRRHRQLLREGREKKGMPVVAIVGYTNAGKSTLLNTLTGAGVLEENKLFATLDPATRLMTLEDGQELLLTDTVGFIRKLPHHLVGAFRSTLEETKYADVILHVADISNPQVEKQMHVVYETLRELGVKDKTIITLLNKQDLLEEGSAAADRQADYTLPISARTGAGLDALCKTLQEVLSRSQILIERVYPYDQAGKTSLIRKYGRLLQEEYREDGIYVKAYIPKEIYGRT